MSKYHKIALLLTVIVGSNINAQYVLDSPDIYSKYALFVPQPFYDLNEISEYLLLNRPKSELDSEYNLIEKEQPIYKWSYVYSEPEYSRYRVFRSHEISKEKDGKRNATVLNHNENQIYSNLSGNNYQTVDGKNKEVIKYYLPYHLNRFIGLNVTEIEQDTSMCSHRKSFLRQAKMIMEHSQYGLIIENGFIVQDTSYTPNEIQLIPFKQLLSSNLKNENVTPYLNRNFVGILNAEKANEILEQATITSIQTKEDYFIDIISGELTSSIIGIGFFDNSSGENEELFWLYYPEFRYSLLDKYTYLSNRLISYSEIFESHQLDSDILTVANEPEYKRIDYDYHFNVKLLPLVYNRLIEKSNHPLSESSFGSMIGNAKPKVGDGKEVTEYLSFSESGITRIEGEIKNNKCEGEFKFYYEDGTIKAIRNYENGILNGIQLNYYPNSVLYMEYSVNNDLIQDLKRYYEDGTLMEEGSFKNGLIHGDWSFRIKLKPQIIEIIKKHHTIFEDKPITYSTDSFSFKLNYTWSNKAGCPPYMMRNSCISVCLQHKFIE